MKIKVEEFDKKFENEDISDYLDFNNSMTFKEFKKNLKKSLQIDLPESIYNLIDKEAEIIGIKPEELIKVWIVERLKETKSL